MSDVSRILSSATVVAIVSFALAAPGAAYADRWSAPDGSGDVAGWHFDPDPAPCGTFTDIDGSADANDDITGLTVRHTPRAVQVVVRFRYLSPRLEQSVSLHLAVPEIRGWTVDVDRFRARSGKFRVLDFMARELREPDPEGSDECGGVSVVVSEGACRTHPVFDFAADTVRVTVPRHCLRDPEWVGVGAVASAWVDPDDPDDPTYGGFWDEWGTPEEGASTWLPPFGPEVPAAPGATVGGAGSARMTSGQREYAVQPGIPVRHPAL
ncbi:hypothetical protein ACVW2K_004039 [Nocardioides sp. HB32]